MILSCTMTRKTKLLSALRRELRISDGLVRRLKPLDAFRVNGEHAHTNRVLLPGDVVSVTIEEAAPDFPPEDGPLDILYEDECLIVIDKPAGLLVHPTFSRQTGTLANYLLGYYRRTGQACAVHVLTRLDRDTMGVVVFAKNAWAHWLLMEELDAGRVEKIYEALTLGGPAEDEGLIDLPIAKRPNPSLLRFVSPAGKPAQTRFRVLARDLPAPVHAVGALTERPPVPHSPAEPAVARAICPPSPHPPAESAAARAICPPDSPPPAEPAVARAICPPDPQEPSVPADPPLCLLELRPLTGRTHQLRVHCAYMGFPILGDPQYHGAGIRDQGSGIRVREGNREQGAEAPAEQDVARAICPPVPHPPAEPAVARAICPPDSHPPAEPAAARTICPPDPPPPAEHAVARAICPPSPHPPAEPAVGALTERPPDPQKPSDHAVGTSPACPPTPARAAGTAVSGQQLVARRITLDHPLTGARMSFVSKIELQTN